MTRNSLLAAVLDLLDGGVALLDANGAIVIANAEFSAFEKRPGLLKPNSSGRLQFRAATHQSALDAALAKVCKDSVPAIAISLNGHWGRLSAMLQGIASTDHPSVCAILVVCEARSTAGFSADMLRAHYGLSAAEAAIALAIAEGKTISEAAAALGVSRATGRNQLAAATTKMDVSRQVEVATALISLVPRLRLKRDGAAE